MARQISKQQQYGYLWIEEAERIYLDDELFEIASCADFPDELKGLLHTFDSIENYEEECASWLHFLFANDLYLALEQSCYQGVLLQIDQRAIRLESCDEKMLSQLRWFFQYCPPLIQARLAVAIHTAVRVERVRRTGNPDWSPKKAIPDPEPHAFFRPPLVKYRNYAR
jgi:hypothetical protein